MPKATVFRFNLVIILLGVIVGAILLVSAVYMQFIINGEKYGWNPLLTFFFILISLVMFLMPFARIRLTDDSLEMWLGGIKRRQVPYSKMRYLTKSLGLLTGYIIAYELDGAIKTIFIFLIWKSHDFLYQLKLHCPNLIVK